MERGIQIKELTEAIEIRRNYLFIISINEYQYFNSLNNAVKDGDKIRSVLVEKYKYDEKYTYFLKDKEATRSKIILKFQNLRKEVTPKDTLLIYFSGHGRLNDKKRGFWVPYEGDPKLEATWISNKDIIDQIDQIDSLHTLIISDSCFSGSLFDVNRDGLVKRLKGEKSRWAITSGRRDQKVSDGYINSPFAEFLFSFFNENDSPEISAGKLYEYLKLTVSRNAEQQPQGGPLFGVGDRGGEYIFELKMDYESAWVEALKINEIEKYNIYINNYPSSPYIKKAEEKVKVLKDERLGWQLVLDNTLLQLKSFIDKYSEGIYIDQAELQYEGFLRLKDRIQGEKVEEEDWIETLKTNSVDAFNSFMTRHPSSKYVVEARKKIDVLIREKEDDQLWESTLEGIKYEKKAEKRKWALSYYLSKKPQGKYIEKAVEMIRDVDDYIEVIESKEIDKLKAYLKKHPDGNFKSQVKKQIDYLQKKEELRAITEAGSIEKLRIYIKECDDEDFKKEAEEFLDKLLVPDQLAYEEAKKIGTKEAYRVYLEDHPNGVYTKKVKLKLEEFDLNAFDSAKKKDEVEAYEKYIVNFPDGIYLNDAIERISILKRKATPEERVPEVNSKIEDMVTSEIESKKTKPQPNLEGKDFSSEEKDTTVTIKDNESIPSEDSIKGEVEKGDSSFNEIGADSKMGNTEQEFSKQILNPVKESDDSMDGEIPELRVTQEKLPSVQNNNKESILAIKIFQENSLELCKQYLEEYPDGMFVQDVKNKIVELNNKGKVQWKRKIGIVVSFVLAVILLIITGLILFFQNLI